MARPALKPSVSLIRHPGVSVTPGVVSAVHQMRAEKGFTDLWSFKPATVTMDPELTPIDRCVYDGVALLAFRAGGECSEPVDMIAAVSCTSRSSALRSLKKLKGRGHIRLVRGKERWQAVYRVGFRDPNIAKPVAPEARKKNPATQPCPRCQQPCRSRANSGWCRGCVRQIEDRQAVRIALASNPTGSEEQIWATVQISGKTRRAREIRRAIQELRVKSA